MSFDDFISLHGRSYRQGSQAGAEQLMALHLGIRQSRFGSMTVLGSHDISCLSGADKGRCCIP